MTYTVDEVSDTLGIPRPTLYRYLREYSIPHLRRSGKISIPEESFDRIQEARELHKEGLGTESVRSKLRNGTDLDPGELTERLDLISESLQGLQHQRPVEETSTFRESLQAILEKQDLLILAVSNLTEKMNVLLSTGDRPQKKASGGAEAEGYAAKTLLHRRERPFESNEDVERVSEARSYAYRGAAGNPATRAAADGPASGVAVDELAVDAAEGASTVRSLPELPEYLYPPTSRGEKFGALARRRRRGVLALLLALLAVAVLAGWWLSTSDEEVEQPGSDGQAVEEDSPSVPAAGDEGSGTIEVPYLVGLALPEAEARLAEAGLEIGDLSETTSYMTPAREVVAQGQQAGAQADPDAPIDLVVSAGPPANQTGVPGGDMNAGFSQYSIHDVSLPVGDAQYPPGRIQPEPFAPVASVIPEAG
ncbi:MAG: helix-turn-helix domain-containing protein [Actinobacteria bacterium]|nr:helix-turn-helix domain-containing protein [Actinomycetota bacterium]